MIHSDSQNLQKVLEAEGRLEAAMRDRDLTVLERLFDDEYLFSGSNGISWGKTKAMTGFKDPGFSLGYFGVRERRVSSNGRTAVVAGVSIVDGQIGSSSLSGQYRFVRIWAIRSGAWRVLAVCTNRTDS